MESLFRQIGRIPGALMIVPLFLGAVFTTFAPATLEIGSFTTALFKTGAAPLIGLFFVCVGSQIDVRAALPAVEKGIVLLLAKYGVAVAVGLGVAFLTPDGTLWGLLPLAIIAAMSNSNGSLFVALTSQFGNSSDKGAISILSINDGPFLTMIALGAAGLAEFPAMALFSAIFPMLLGFVIGNTSPTARAFLAPGEKIIIPFAAFALGTGINFGVLLNSGAIGLLLGLATVVVSGGAAVLALYLWHIVRRHPRPTRNLIAGACEASTAGNAIATPAAVALIDPSLAPIQGMATAQVAAAVVATAFTMPFVVAWLSSWQKRRGVSPENEEAMYEGGETTFAMAPQEPS
ncbi:2-keto-3-deoxygluconate permease [Celeribacter sp. SCSIO 80788]|jgi:2-keto-3-deoxygluconate permease|uniref:2-keto-3-deoxygluconate permease n=1 Tax=Celeribacter sp. SCSIO 80788 TaxID=3117013 RepID=UPI003DA69C59